MPHEIAFADSVVQPPVKVLGLRLRSYSIGHELILASQRNPLVILDGPQFSVFSPESQREAIQNAVLVCYRSWTENKQPDRWVNLWKWRIRKSDFFRATNEFLSYRSAGTTFPPPPSDHARQVLAKDKEERGRLLGSPFICRLYNFVSRLPDHEIKQCGETAFDFPIGFASFLYLSHLEQEGCAKIENSDEHKIQRDYEAMLADVPAERRLA